MAMGCFLYCMRCCNAVMNVLKKNLKSVRTSCSFMLKFCTKLVFYGLYMYFFLRDQQPFFYFVTE